MASLRRVPKSPYWIACFRGADGKPRQRSTKVIDRNDALRVALKFEEASRAARAGLLVEAQARKVIGEIYEIGNQTTLRSVSIREFLTGWVKSKSLDAGEKTHQRYGVGIRNFLDFLDASSSRNLIHLSSKMINDFRVARAEVVTAGSVNVDLKILRAALNSARKEGLLLANPCDAVPLLRQERFNRRPFTVDEIKALLSVADSEWKGIILIGIYTGLRLGDIVSLTWENVNLQQREIVLTTQKTDRHQVLPIAGALAKFLEQMPNGTAGTPLFPSAFDLHSSSPGTGGLSKRFRSILLKAGLRKEGPPAGNGRKAKRMQYSVSFHSFRHTAASMLRNAGVSDVIAKEILGHESDAVARTYSHIDMEAKRRAVELLPDLR